MIRQMMISLAAAGVCCSAWAQSHVNSAKLGSTAFGDWPVDVGSTIDVPVQLAETREAVLDDISHRDGLCAAYLVGGEDLQTWYFIEIDLPACLKDGDGGTIRLIMQHEVDVYDQVRIIDEHIATESETDRYGERGRFAGRYGWTRQSAGGEYAWILGDQNPHYVARPWDWVLITDFAWGQGNGVLGDDKIRIYSHPHVTTRVIITD